MDTAVRLVALVVITGFLIPLLAVHGFRLARIEQSIAKELRILLAAVVIVFGAHGALRWTMGAQDWQRFGQSLILLTCVLVPPLITGFLLGKAEIRRLKKFPFPIPSE